MINRIFLALIASLSLSCATKPSQTDCVQIRGAIDVGSGSTKAYVASVDVCQKRILNTLWTEQEPIGFKEALQKANDKRLNDELIENAHRRFLSLIEKARQQKAQRITAVATAAFREARNGSEAAARISAGSDIPLRIVSQEEEARLGVTAAQAVAKPTPDQAGVWDIGGGSMQITYADSQGRAQIYAGDLASVSFKERVIQNIQKKKLSKTTSPNPLGPAWEPAVELARQYCLRQTPEDLKVRAKEMRWLGIGGVWWHSLRKQVATQGEIGEPELARTLSARSHLTDSAIGGSYAATEITNLALVLGFMRCLGIQKVEPVEASLVQGLVLE